MSSNRDRQAQLGRWAPCARRWRRARPYLIAGFVTAFIVAMLLNLAVPAVPWGYYNGGVGSWKGGLWVRRGTRPDVIEFKRSWYLVADELCWSFSDDADQYPGAYPPHWSRAPFMNIGPVDEPIRMYERVVGWPAPAWYGRIVMIPDGAGNWRAGGPSLRWPWRTYPWIHHPPRIIGVVPVIHGLFVNTIYFALWWYVNHLDLPGAGPRPRFSHIACGAGSRAVLDVRV